MAQGTRGEVGLSWNDHLCSTSRFRSVSEGPVPEAPSQAEAA